MCVEKRRRKEKNIPENSSLRSILHQSHHSWWLMDLILYILLMVKSLLFYRMCMSIAIHIHPLSPSICVAWLLRIAREFFFRLPYSPNYFDLPFQFDELRKNFLIFFYFYSLRDFLLNEIWIFLCFFKVFHPLCDDLRKIEYIFFFCR